MIRVEFLDASHPRVVLERGVDASVGAWSRLQEAYSRGIVGGDVDRVEVRPDVFLAELDVLRDVRKLFGQQVLLGPRITQQLTLLADDRRARESSLDLPEIDPTILGAELRAAGFCRELKPFQLRNLSTLTRLPHGADFSVPGAGKTTVALASFALQRERKLVNRALVIAPIAAFAAWKEDAVACFSERCAVSIHANRTSLIPENTDILLTNYNRVASDYDRISSFVTQFPTQVILDEAHRVKKGALGVHGRAVLDLAYAAKRRDVLTGTPAPQSAFDLIALIRFLYPGQDRQILPRAAYVERAGRDADVLSDTSKAIRRYFVRTTKSQLALPPTSFGVVRRAMPGLQSAIYGALVGRYRATFRLETQSRREFDRLGRIAMYLLEAATNPMLLLAGSDIDDELGFQHPPLELRGDERLKELLAAYNRYETPWKFAEIESIVREAAYKGEKVLVWSSFVRNLRALARHLAAYGPAVVHGGVPSGDEPKDSNVATRDMELTRFRNDPACVVLLANPAACGEGVSLHHWCHHAVYLDRTFNAGHFLQSQDRIHRLGLPQKTITRYTILCSLNTIDETVDGRLRSKVVALSRLMDDPGLVQVALPESDERNSTDPPVAEDDLQAVLGHLESSPEAHDS